MANVNYSFTDKDANGNIVFRSNITSFGLDHVTDKDLTSFYTNFSQNAYQDTGLMPVDGSGLLAIRSAGNHTQIAYQHKPGMYYINWGSYEGDREAIKYYVAQPYRIVIADLLNGNIYGARTFYSPIPITYPQAPLYHVNLPNINCKGYRGNGVGWICLYHSEDISQYPFNEKLAKILDRCSGTEAYNDQNMKETDGPRFYEQNHKPSYIYNPEEWQSYSEANGYEWTLDPELWIPVLVQDMDHQDKHYKDGQPLTFADALFGNYQAYYTDTLIPKPVNMIARNDYNLDSKIVFNWFKQSYNNSSESIQEAINPFDSSAVVRNNLSTAAPVFVNHDDDEEEDEENWYCEDCSTTYYYSESSPNETYSSNYVCNNCLENSYVYVKHKSTYVHLEDTLYLENSDCYVYVNDLENGIDYKYCSGCDAGWYNDHPDFESIKISDSGLCHACFEDVAKHNCFCGNKTDILFNLQNDIMLFVSDQEDLGKLITSSPSLVYNDEHSNVEITSPFVYEITVASSCIDCFNIIDTSNKLQPLQINNSAIVKTKLQYNLQNNINQSLEKGISGIQIQKSEIF
jgi:hypothetical protein